MNQNPCQHNLVLPARKQCEMKSVVNAILSFYNQECLTDIVMYHKKKKVLVIITKLNTLRLRFCEAGL